jgi:hypothetical protein
MSNPARYKTIASGIDNKTRQTSPTRKRKRIFRAARDSERAKDTGRARDTERVEDVKRAKDTEQARDTERVKDIERAKDAEGEAPAPEDNKKSSSPTRKRKRAAKVDKIVEEMIIVHVNDRLGTKAAIPCLASDPIKLFKAQVAARIGREPHEIMLKRQGERPFKDQLTLADYGVSNGVQLDLEMDTGD